MTIKIIWHKMTSSVLRETVNKIYFYQHFGLHSCNVIEFDGYQRIE
jgi:hypothetical protein